MISSIQYHNFQYTKGVFLIAVSAILWSTGGAILKITALTAYQVCFWRSLFALLTLIAIVKPKQFALEVPNIIASISYALTMLFFILATKLTTVANAVFLQYTAPLYIVIISYLLFNVMPKKSEAIAMIGCVIGMIIFFFDSIEVTGFIGMFWAVMSAIAYAFFNVFSKKRTKGHFAEPVVAAAALAMLISAFVVIFEAWDDPRGLFHKDVYCGFAVGTADSILVAFLGVFQIGIPCLMYSKGLQSVSSLEAGFIAMIEPVLTPVWAYAFVGEKPSLNAIAGGSTIVVAILLHTIQMYSRKGNESRQSIVA